MRHTSESVQLTAPQHLHLPFVAPSLGGVESLVTLPAQTSHLALGLEGRKVKHPIHPPCKDNRVHLSCIALFRHAPGGHQ